MKNTKGISNFFACDDEKRKKVGRKIPEIIKETREIAGTENGKSLELTNCKACKLIVDNEAYEEKDFKKLFPNRYSSFNIKKTFRNKGLKEKAVFEEILYFYFPTDLLLEHDIKVVCRKKMLEITYVF
ncbi:hypothetical protein [Clostridium polynesiense]|uniref:hypothetical protein n=1 Tax=Clostridium polynesiense TaxID=1325933 RepID=UPI00058E03D4|nr:hypothetical protein [Clostridium polynesiense]